MTGSAGRNREYSDGTNSYAIGSRGFYVDGAFKGVCCMCAASRESRSKGKIGT
jgi:hypothetical protein